MQQSLAISATQRWWLWIIGTVALLFLMLPSILVVVMAFSDSPYLAFPPETWSLRWFENYFTSTVWQDATKTSVLAAILTTVLATVAGTAAAYSIHHQHSPGGDDQANPFGSAGLPANPASDRDLLRLRANRHEFEFDRAGAGAFGARHTPRLSDDRRASRNLRLQSGAGRAKSRCIPADAPRTSGAPQRGKEPLVDTVADRNGEGPRQAGATPRPVEKPITGADKGSAA